MSGVDNPQAFPSMREKPLIGGARYRDDVPGMSLRDWFAGKILTGVMACRELQSAMAPPEMTNPEANAAIAAAVYRIADAMLAERAKGGAA